MGDNKSILYVEDEKSIREMFEEALTMHGHNVHTYENGLVAHNAIKSGKINPGLILTDFNYRIPEMDGLGFLKIYAQKIPCIMITGDKNRVEQRALDLGAKVVLGKPIRSKELSDAVNLYYPKMKNNY